MRRALLIASGLLGLSYFGLGLFWLGQQTDVGIPVSKSTELLSVKPSIAVLPLVNLSNDPEQDYLGSDLEEALIAIRRAKELNPKHSFSYLWVEGHILFNLGRYDEALVLLENVVFRNPSFLVGHLTLAATCEQLELFEQAEWTRQEIRVLAPDFSTTKEGQAVPYRQKDKRDHYLAGLRKAGFSN